MTLDKKLSELKVLSKETFMKAFEHYYESMS